MKQNRSIPCKATPLTLLLWGGTQAISLCVDYGLVSITWYVPSVSFPSGDLTSVNSPRPPEPTPDYSVNSIECYYLFRSCLISTSFQHPSRCSSFLFTSERMSPSCSGFNISTVVGYIYALCCWCCCIEVFIRTSFIYWLGSTYQWKNDNPPRQAVPGTIEPVWYISHSKMLDRFYYWQ